MEIIWIPLKTISGTLLRRSLFLKVCYNFWKNIAIQAKNKNLKLGYNVSIKNCSFGKNNYISNGCSINNCEFGDYSYVGENSSIANTTIGKFCSIGPNVKIGLGEHPTKFLSTHPSFYSTNKQVGKTFTKKNLFQEYSNTTIGNDIWIGANVVVKSGLTIPNGVILASGTVLTNQPEPYGIYGGVPGKLIRKRFENQIIEALNKSKWWDFEDLRILSSYQDDVESFINKYAESNDHDS